MASPNAKRTRPKTRTTKRVAPTAATTKKALVEGVFKAYGLPGWLGWGTIGKESSYGTNNPGNDHYFGLIEPSYSGLTPNASLAHDAVISARLYKSLIKEHGGLAGAVSAYTGGEYGVSEIQSLARGGSTQGKEKVAPSEITEASKTAGAQVPVASFLGGIPGAGPGLELGEKLLEGGAGKIGGDIASSILPQPVVDFFSVAIRATELLVSLQFWIRVGEVIGGIILIHMGLKELTGQGLVPSGTGGRLTDAAAAGAAAL